VSSLPLYKAFNLSCSIIPLPFFLPPLFFFTGKMKMPMQIQFLRPEASLIRPTTGGAVKVFGRRRLMRRRRPLPVSVFCGSQTNSLAFFLLICEQTSWEVGEGRELLYRRRRRVAYSSFVFRVVESLALPRLNSRTTSRLSRSRLASRGEKTKILDTSHFEPVKRGK
jgi:hypothetical protein